MPTTYHVLVTSSEDEGGFSGTVVDLPGVISQGETMEELKENIREAISLFLESKDEMERRMQKIEYPQLIEMTV